MILEQDNFITEFISWKEENFNLYKDGLYYPKKFGSKYFNILKVIDFKRQEPYSMERLLNEFREI